MDIHLDVDASDDFAAVEFTPFRDAIRTLGAHMTPWALGACSMVRNNMLVKTVVTGSVQRRNAERSGGRSAGGRAALVILETTVPPGTCERVVAPELAAALQRRGLQRDAFLLAHSYERVMPGEDYLASITHFWRVYAGHTPEAADACERFLAQVINVDEYPLTRLASTTASEIAKVMENSYRATNIAFIEEWARFAEAVGVDLFGVINAIRVRPTHSNIRQPGFGVGGYCLTKDLLFPGIAPLPLSDRVWRTILTLPCSTSLTQQEQETVIAAVHSAVRSER